MRQTDHMDLTASTIQRLREDKARLVAALRDCVNELNLALGKEQKTAFVAGFIALPSDALLNARALLAEMEGGKP